MKKLMLVLVILAVIGGAVFAFDPMSYPPPVEGGNIMVDAGIGLRGMGYSGSSWIIPPLFVQAEYALPVGVPISVGALFTIEKFGYNWTPSDKWTWTDITIAGRGNWHFGFDIDWLDFYAGISLGYTIDTFSSSGGSSWGTSYGGFFWSGQVGAHFYFTKMIGAMVEAGYPYWIKAGVAIKF